MTSLNQQKKKNVTKEAAQNIIELKDWSLSNQLCRTFLRIIGVIGNQALEAFSRFYLHTSEDLT